MVFALVALLRLGAALLIFRFPLGGALASIAGDYFDFLIFDSFGWGGVSISEYQLLDKYFDTVYLAVELWVALRWKDRLLRDTAIGLFVWRSVGILVFAATGKEEALFLFPNIFEYFYLFVVLTGMFAPRFKVRRAFQLALILMVLAVPKFFNEYVLHVRKTSTAAFFAELVAPRAENPAVHARED
jgi:hypothetical protein